MQIAITSQNRRSITGHAGKCRNFWIYEIQQGKLQGRRLLELSQDDTFHASHHDISDELSEIGVLITAGLGNGLYLRLLQRGILPIVTADEDPDHAIDAYLNNTLEPLSVVHNNDCHDHAH
jgi:predicted Fe-Mo cluster-binding NifX family protein